MEKQVNTILRKGKIGQYKQIRVGDIYIGTCWICKSRCLCEKLGNGHTRHFADKDLMALFEKEIENGKINY